MKLVILIMTTCLLQVSANTLAQKLTYVKNDVTIRQIFKEITKQTGYEVLYADKNINDLKKIDVNFKNVPLKEVLNTVLGLQNVTYIIDENKGILIQPKENSFLDRMVAVLARIDVHGRVTDENDQGLAGASIKVKGTGKGVTSDNKGTFFITNIDKDAILVISYVGYETKEVKASENLGDIKMTLSSGKLDEMVFKGYYSTSKRLNTGNVVKITSEEISRQPVSNVLATLSGRVPGMLVTQGSGLPGGAFKVEVRGRTAIDRGLTDDQPLFIIDGIPVAANNGSLSVLSAALGNPASLTNPGGISPFAGLNTSDIESVEVLKDGDATAIYGSRGANGVVLITTKKGKVGKTSVDVNVYSGYSEVAKKLPMLNTKQYVAMRKQAFINDGIELSPDEDAFDILTWDTTRYTDFNKLLGRNIAYNNDANVTLSGGSKAVQFLMGAAYHKETTVLPGNLNLQRGSMHFNVGHTSTNQRFKATLSGSYSADGNNLTATDFASYYDLPPNLKLYDEAGNLAFNEGGIFTQGPLSNPMAYFKQSYSTKTNNLVGNILLSYEIIKGLTARLNAGYNTTITDEIQLYPKSASNPVFNSPNTSTFAQNRFISYLIEPQAEYRRQLGNGQLNILLGSTIQSTNNNTQQITASGFPAEVLMESLTGATSITGTRSISQYRYNAIFGRINYNLMNRYLLNFTARRDGSSRFGSDKQFANFGSVGAGWIFSDEAFIPKNDVLSFGKLRGSIGLTGNDKITNYQYLDTWTTTQYNYSTFPALYPTKLFNPDYRWERTVKREIGLELGFLHDDIQTSIVYFNNGSSNQLVQYKLPNFSGFSSIVANLPAKVANSGWEFTFTSTNFKRKSFTWTTSANLTLPKSTLVDFPNLEASSYKSTYIEGKSLNLIYKYKYTGVDPQTGLNTFLDVNNDNALTVDDYQYGGNTDPKFYGGLSNSFSYKSLQLDLFFSFRKQLGRSYLGSIYPMPGQMGNLPVAMTGFWTKPGDHATLQRLSQGYGDAYTAWNNFSSSSNGIYTDASFIRLSNVSFSWTLPTIWVRKAHINTARVYLQGQNLLTITGYEIGDPETQNLATTPPLRTIVAGIQLNF